MNLHVPQSVNARADAENMDGLEKYHHTSERRNVMGIVQDACWE